MIETHIIKTICEMVLTNIEIILFVIIAFKSAVTIYILIRLHFLDRYVAEKMNDISETLKDIRDRPSGGFPMSMK